MNRFLRGPACRPFISSYMSIMMMISMTVIMVSCAPVMKMVYGLQTPSPMNHEQVIDFRNNVFGDTMETAYLQPQASQDLTEWSVPEAFLFDSSGRPIDFRNPEKPRCNGPLSSFLENLRPMQQHPPAQLEHMQLLIQSFAKIPCTHESMQLPPADYHLMITFSTWAGKQIFKQIVRSWIQAARSNHHVQIHVTLLNVDEIHCSGGLNGIR